MTRRPPRKLTLNQIYPDPRQRERLYNVAYAVLCDDNDPAAAMNSLINAGVNPLGARLLVAYVSKFIGKATL